VKEAELVKRISFEIGHSIGHMHAETKGLFDLIFNFICVHIKVINDVYVGIYIV